MDDYLDIEYQMIKYYREKIAQEIEDCLYAESEDKEYSDHTRWFNEGLRHAIIIARYGFGYPD